MKIEFSTAKNGSKTCLINDKYIHSSYNPQKEAERFVSLCDSNFLYKTVIITEPCLSYCAEYLRIKFPTAKLIAIRFCHDFDFCNNLWDKIFYVEKDTNNFENQLFNFLGEEELLNTLFLCWQTSASAFQEINELAWKSIKNTLEKSKAILATRSYFAKRWLKNTIRFFLLSQKFTEIKKGTSQVVITASGPSLLSSIPFLKKYKDSFFLIALSSSINVLIENGITPDLCFSTDGGYYAKKHLEILENRDSTIPIALSCESACSSKLLCKSTILPLTYNDFPSSFFYETLNIKPYFALRNGTVSGTAIQFALSITDSDVFVCGLDMCETKGFQHTQPNVLEKSNEISDFRLKTKIQRLSISGFHSESMEIYRNWFCTQNNEFTNRVKRLSFNFKYNNKLGNIKDFDWKDFFSQKNTIKPQISLCNKSTDRKTKQNLINQLIESISSSDNWLKNVFPADYISYNRCNNNEQKDKLKKSLEDKNKTFLNSLRKTLYV